MKYTLRKSFGRPFFVSRDSLVVEVNKEFLNLSGFSENEILGKSLTEVSRLIRIDSQISLGDIANEYSCFMFTKEYEPREVTITHKNLENENAEIFFIKEKFSSKVEDVFPCLAKHMLDNEIGTAIFSIDGVLLNANHKYWSFGDRTYIRKEDLISKNMKEIYTGYNGNYIKTIFNDIIQNGQPINKRGVKFEHIEGGETYWDISLVPVYISGKLKYIVNKVTEVTEKVRNRMLIEEQKQELEAIIQNMSDGLIIVDNENKFMMLNNCAKEFFYKPDSVINVNDSFKDTQYYDSDGNLIEVGNSIPCRVLRGERIKESRIRIHRSDGIFYYSISGSPIYDKNGYVEKAVLCTRDITDRVNNENLIKQQKEQVEVIIEDMSDAMAIFDKEGNFISINKSIKENMFFVKEMLVQADFYCADGSIIPKELLSIQRLLKCKKMSNIRIDIKINNTFINTEINYTPIYEKDGSLAAGVLLIKDITDKIKDDEAQFIKTQYELLNKMIENLEIGLLRYSYPEFTILDMNNKVINFLKQKDHDFCIADQFLPTKDQIKLMEIASKLVKKNGGSYIYKFKNFIGSEEKFLKLIFQPLIGINNNIVEVIVIVVDITEVMKEKSKMEEALKVQDEIFANVSHELKTPLNTIFSTNQLMELYLRNDSLETNREKLYGKIEIIRRNCYRFTKLINNITDLSKIDSGLFEMNLRNENIAGIIENIVQAVAEYIKGKGLSIIYRADTDAKIIACDPGKIERIILNLISNAIKFSNPVNEIFVNVTDKGEVVEISIKDTGIGIDKKHLNSIFKRFHRVDKSLYRNAEGSGIGLAIVKSLVEMHDGKITVESEVGRGSNFIIELPARLVEQSKEVRQTITDNNKTEMVNIEFSDIYNL